MPDLSPLCALGAFDSRSERFGALRLTEVPDLGLVSIALRKGAEAPAPFGLALPGPGAWAEGATASALWTGPGQWLLELPGQGAADVVGLVAPEAPGCSLTEQTDGWACIEITSTAGAAPLEALRERLVNLAPGTLAPGHGTRTILHHMSVLVIRRAPDRLAVLGMRSAADSLWHALSETAARLETQE
ncbi:hypothetical protein GCM10011415_24520 [Salipiger pallidus]|uniref:Sarcosine oxidase subunit gamma n=1 Tax=Salipiger pallidus TaxID=1775170 RepID=A0A8J2ZKA5_9RHOB|nr:sarcosine oxidase subunit gamma [Salipiger pallidus]GGG75072.1 hypothetical protein GCM10011415_24520 [Salipiger pallidus]